MDILSLYNDFGIKSAGKDERHYRAGWIQTPCPFCLGHQGNHLGYNINDNYFNCHRCGWKSTQKVLSKLTGLPPRDIPKLIQKYKGFSKVKQPKIKVKRKAFKQPTTKPINKMLLHQKYMLKRGFSAKDMEILEKDFQLQAIPYSGAFGNMDLKYRIFAPIFYKGEMVSWQTRDCTGKAQLKYITCPGEREKIPHKHILYRYPEGKEIILTEGIFDVWKIYCSGFPQATCCFGVEYTKTQLYEIIQHYKKVIIFFDPDRAGKKKAQILYRSLLYAGLDCDIVKNDTKKDPGEMDKKIIQKLITPYLKPKD